jgi:hypothetical protein
VIDQIVEHHIAELQARVKALEIREKALEIREAKRRAREAKYVERIRVLELEADRRRQGVAVDDELSPKEYAARHGVSVPTVRRAYSQAKLEHRRRGRLVWIPAGAQISPQSRPSR